jgi:hypothetical protein
MQGALRGFLLVPALLVLAALSGAGPSALAEGAPKIRLESNESADRCIQDEACLEDLFLKAVLGDANAAIKWTGPARVASFAGEGAVPRLIALLDRTMTETSLLARAAGADLQVADAHAGEAVNMVILASDDFTRDREGSFKALLEQVFAGDRTAYDDLAASPAPICDSRPYVNEDGAIVGALALVEADAEPRALRRCLTRLALDMLGLRHALPAGVDAILNRESPRDAWTSIDFLLLKLLYDPSLQPNATRTTLTAAFAALYRNALSPSS